ncbi:hypothetical protein TU86_20045 [Pseudomonas weihenstephanensis]|uniref:Uncharacterized protein n=1 Tax=Pseudomonas weihenstephanensis TaxID=1608994 RepID=A0A0J6IHZ0_9PSED|nr:hypothetical protein [Pseudomonas weihenstephanensis]KMN11948.1 hypothetical protein TU86_20045 [Pseudomonas weihenstephanensis]
MPTENKSTAPLQVERSTVTKLVITGAANLDPITVFLEDLAPCKGKITVSCWSKSWTAYWGGMWDGLNIGQFFCKLNTAYIIGYFDQAISPRQFSGEALANKAQITVLKERRGGELGQDEARELFTEAEDFRDSPSIDHLHSAHSELMSKLFGDEWWHLTNDATEPNPDYAYLERIIHAVQQALSQEHQQVAA